MKIKQNIAVINHSFLINAPVNLNVTVYQLITFKMKNLLKTIKNVFANYLGLMMMMLTFVLSKTHNQNPLNYINHTSEMICS